MESLSTEISFPRGSGPWHKKRRTLHVSSWATGPKDLEGSDILTIEDYVKRDLPQNAFDTCGPGDCEVGEDKSAASSSDEKMPTTRRGDLHCLW